VELALLLRSGSHGWRMERSDGGCEGRARWRAAKESITPRPASDTLAQATCRNSGAAPGRTRAAA
jgi:hypothetical protein